jgi:protein-tyrosine-phosphatase
MMIHQVNVLFVSRRNTVRSILAQSCLNHLGKGKFRSFSCGKPTELGATPHPLALEALTKAGLPTSDLRCTGWDKFSRIGSPRMDWVINLAQDISGELPIWSHHPDVATWSCKDLLSQVASEGNLFAEMTQALFSIHRRLEILTNLPMREADRSALRSDIRDIGYSV